MALAWCLEAKRVSKERGLGKSPQVMGLSFILLKFILLEYIANKRTLPCVPWRGVSDHVTHCMFLLQGLHYTIYASTRGGGAGPL